MSATEDDTELTDLLIQNLENTGVLNKLKAEMRAAVFLAMEEQDKVESKTPLINENLRKCLNTKEGRLAASLVIDFLQVFNLDFTLAVFQPEINAMNGLDGREQICREMSLSPSEMNNNSPLLLELVRRGRHKPSEDPARRDDPQQRIPRGAPAVGAPDLRAPGVRGPSSSLKMEALDLEEEEDGDSFFDDPLPKPQKTYGGFPLGEKDWSEKSSQKEKVETPHPRDNPAGSLSERHKPGGGGGGGGSTTEQSHSRNDDDVEYDDDFNSHRSDFSKSELSIGEEIEEVSIEGPETSDKLDETTQDLSVSQVSQSHGADYMEEVA
ncbi:centrosomal protein 43 isoform X4 [Antennarius striatus]|uniref:centrosomal protein 43 isoform X4 n=1 Tax=Antennarius striatus TaxID=241820 RepID=UPI0035B33FDA